MVFFFGFEFSLIVWNFILGCSNIQCYFFPKNTWTNIHLRFKACEVSSLQLSHSTLPTNTSGFAGCGAYTASKHAVIGLTRVAAKENGDREIRVNAVAPGAILTPLLARAREANPDEGKDNDCAIKREGMAEEIAGVVAFLLGSESGYVTGSVSLYLLFSVCEVRSCGKEIEV